MRQSPAGFDLGLEVGQDEAADLAAAAEILRGVAEHEDLADANPLAASRAELALERLRATNPSEQQLQDLADRLSRRVDPDVLPLDLRLLVRQRRAQVARQRARRPSPPALIARTPRIRVHLRGRGRARRPGCSSRRRPSATRAGPSDDPGGDDPPGEQPGRASRRVEDPRREGEL